MVTNNLKQLERIIQNIPTSGNITSAKVLIEECDDNNVSSNLQKEDFPPVFDDCSTSMVPKVEETLSSRSQKGSGSTTMSDEKSCQSSVSILITDTSNSNPRIKQDNQSIDLENSTRKDISTDKEMDNIDLIHR